ncbi:hypothetical protein PG993_000194 [Apiospora rasikravindrae]|uniref:Clr5 domain-containing protein n=1 Tax=Apiospora rasikravindrae TaxID=990691 RepID=A0ABR1U8B8_9PEZI
MASKGVLRCTDYQKDFSIWDRHKDMIQTLYLTEGKSLKQVAAAMENVPGFPSSTDLSTYEVVLRDYFQFRKNLDCWQWLLVERELEERKQEGHDSIVVLCGIQLNPTLVSKKIRRARIQSQRGHRKTSSQQRLPEFVEIVSDTANMPLGNNRCQKAASSDVEALSVSSPIDPGRSILRPKPKPLQIQTPTVLQTRDLQRTYSGIQIVSTFSPRLSPVVVPSECLGNELTDLVLNYKIEQAHAEMQADLPSKQLVRHLQESLGNKLPVPLDSAYQICYRQQVSAQAQDVPHLNPSCPPLPRMFGKNSSVDILETACFKLSNGFQDVHHEHSTYGLLDWIGNSADPTLLKEFFSLENPAVAALWWDLMMGPTRSAEQYSTLLKVGLAVREAEWFRYEFDTDFFDLALVDEHNDRAARTMDV